MRLAYTIRETGVLFIGKDLQTLNGQNKLTLWAGRISKCRNSGQNVRPGAGKMESVSRLATNGSGGYSRWPRFSRGSVCGSDTGTACPLRQCGSDCPDCRSRGSCRRNCTADLKAMLCQYYFISGVKKSVQNKQFFLNAITINREPHYCSAACNYALPKASVICLCITYMFDSIIKLPQEISYISAIPLT